MKMKMMMDDGQDLLLLYKYIHLETDKLKFKNKTKNVMRDEVPKYDTQKKDLQKYVLHKTISVQHLFE